MPKPAVFLSVAAVVLVLVVAGVLLSGGGGDEPGPAPQGYAKFSGDFGGQTVRFSYPRAWGAAERTTEQGVQIVRFRGPPDAAGERSVVRLNAKPDTTADFDVQFNLIDGNDRLQLLNDNQLSKEDVDVPGAEQATKRVLEYDLKTTAGVQRSRSSAIFALGKRGLFVSLIVDPLPAKPDVDAGAVLESLTLDG